MLHKNVDRIAAEEDMRAATIAVMSQSSEAIQSMMTDLRAQLGRVVEIDTALADAVVRADPARKARLNMLGDLSNHEYPG